jgi:hypothetical protein
MVSKKSMRAVFFAGLLVIGLPTQLLRDVGHSFGSWDALSSAIVGVRFESNAPVRVGAEEYFAHTTTLLAVFKRDSRLPAVAEKLTLFESRGQFATDDGTNPPWDTELPMPVGGHLGGVFGLGC